MKNHGTDGAGEGFRPDRRFVLMGVGGLAAAGIAGGGAGAFAAQQGQSTVSFSAPIPIAPDSVPWGTAMDGNAREAVVKHYDYVEEEYFLSGTCNVYGP